MKFNYIPLICLVLLITSGRSVKNITWTEEELQSANTAFTINYLTEEEKKVIQLINLARLNGEKYYYTFYQEYLKKHNLNYTPRINPSNTYSISLKHDLFKSKNLPLLQPDEALSMAAKYHAKDMGSANKTGHISSNGMKLNERIKKFSNKNPGAIAENCSYGHNEAFMIVGQFLLDEGVPDLGHRKNILNAIYRKVGVSIEQHKEYSYNCVIDFSN